VQDEEQGPVVDAQMIQRLSRPVPRYTSYPTANHFTGRIGPVHYVDWLGGLDEAAPPLSLYLHIPFCHAMCWYCACTTKAVRRYEPVRRYVDALVAEIANVADVLGRRAPVAHIHWGGGSPSLLEPDDIRRISNRLSGRFRILPGAEHALEVDPRQLTEQRVAAFIAAGVNRVSLGVQDFDEKVQAAIGREQSVAMTERAVDLFRHAGVAAVNIDLVYGLPHQTTTSLARTIAEVLRLAPTRIAAFGYAHLPARVPNQRLIDQGALPDAGARFEQARLIGRLLAAGGYRSVGIDHFVRDDDPLAQRPVHRNFQGYTSDAATSLIGFGASAIGRLPGGYVQNALAAREYERRIAEEGLATARGIALSGDDQVRAHAIERLMCDFSLSPSSLLDKFGSRAEPVVADMARIVRDDTDGLLTLAEDRIVVTERGRPFVRTICARLDRYLDGMASGRHSAAV
jgi:oxygen-independent coproporphyrinogen-3 oxidase